MFTTLYINFSDAQGQITLELVVVSGRNLNSSKLSCMSSLPARIKGSIFCHILFFLIPNIFYYMEELK